MNSTVWPSHQPHVLKCESDRNWNVESSGLRFLLRIAFLSLRSNDLKLAFDAEVRYIRSSSAQALIEALALHLFPMLLPNPMGLVVGACLSTGDTKRPVNECSQPRSAPTVPHSARPADPHARPTIVTASSSRAGYVEKRENASRRHSAFWPVFVLQRNRKSLCPGGGERDCRERQSN
jgi:hypothetical protein